VILGFDTSTSATAAGLLLSDGRAFEARDDPGPDERPAHASRLLGLLEQVLEAGGAGWEEVVRLAVGIGPGGFTGLRIGVATARGLAQARGLPVVGVGSLHALAARAPDVAAVLDARRGEVYAAVWRAGELTLAPSALTPQALVQRLPAGVRAVGEGAVRFRDVLTVGGADVPPEAAPEHRLSAVEVCRLAAAADPTPRDALEPDYRREPDATPPPSARRRPPPE